MRLQNSDNTCFYFNENWRTSYFISIVIVKFHFIQTLQRTMTAKTWVALNEFFDFFINSFFYCSAIIILSLCVAINIISAQVTGGPCPNLQGVANFNVKKYLGSWYEFKKYPNFFSRGAKCITATYALQKDGNVSVLNQQTINGTADKILGYARPISSGVLGVNFPTVPCES